MKDMIRLAAVALAVTVMATTAQAQLAGWYEFDGDTTDSSGNAYDASGGGTYGTGIRGQALDISGIGSRYAIAPLNTSPGTTPQVTIGAWVYTTSDQAYQTIVQQDGDFARKLVIDDRGPTYPVDGYAAFDGYNDNGGLTGVLQGKPTAGNINQWVFIAATYDNATSTTTVYVDDQVATNTDSFTRIAPGRNNLHIGSILGQYEPFQGLIDDVFVFEGVLNATQIAAIRDASDPLAAAQAVSATMSKHATDVTTTVKMDFGDGNNLATGIGAGWETWQSVTRSGSSASASNLVDVDGNATGWNFSILNGIAGTWNNGGEAAASDYFYTSGSGGYSPDFVLSGLTPGATYRLTPIGGIGGAPQFLLPDTDGDGDNYFDDATETYINNETFSGQTRSIEAIASGAGQIVGEFYFNQWWEGQMAGLVVEEVVPEPTTMALLGLGGLMAIRRRRSA